MQPDVIASSTLLMLPASDITDGDSEVPLSQLWDEFQAECVIHIDDYFDKIQQRIKSGDSIFSTILPSLKDELGVEDINKVDLLPPTYKDMYENYGIDVDTVIMKTSQHATTKTTVDVSSNELLYLWKSMPAG
ncbi:hypothetical protein J3R82DRAFT_5231 [Butyriboletus roseoflavus]|nr:hypothetical protein J3R82DRAFT_5231 [Butyriboletus roseoflavus]